MALQKRRWAWIGFGIVLLLLIVLALRPKPVPADFSAAVRGPLRVTIDEEGETRVRNRFVISAPVAGRVLRLELEPGDSVRAGATVLATFQPQAPVLLDARSRAEAEARVKAAEAALGLARAERDRRQAELDFARAELERMRRLAGEEVVSREAFESTELREKTAEKALRVAEFSIKSAEQDLAAARASLVQNSPGVAGVPIVIHSPVDGVVLKRLRESEAVVLAGEPLVEVADPADLEIVSDLLSTDAVKVRAGQKVLIEQWGGDHALEGNVRRVEPSGFTKISALGVEEQRVNVIVDFTDPRAAWQALGDGFRVEIRVVVWERDDVVKVPVASLFRQGEDWAVFTVTEDRAGLQKIEIGERNDLEAEVVSGLAEGEKVIVHPSDKVADGVGVVAR